MNRWILVLILCSACAVVLVPDKEWSDDYDPAAWRKQFEQCRDKLYTFFPDEIVQSEWQNCMVQGSSRVKYIPSKK